MAKKQSEKRWFFSPHAHGELEGLNDPLLVTFDGDYEYYVARETIQNAIDAKNTSSKKPVKVVFEWLSPKVSDIPGLEELEMHFNACNEQTLGDDNPKTKRHFENALKLLKEKKLSILKISDFNTVGLDGDDEGDGRWSRLIKGVGQNKMSGVGGGSFGIGKGAPMVASPIRTVFYTSMDTAGNIAFQGKTKLITHKIGEETLRATGWYGMNNEGWKAVRNTSDIPKLFNRTETGTDIYILGYVPNDEDWKAPLITSIVKNFWMAIHDRDLELVIKDSKSTLEINKSNLYELLSQYGSSNALPYYLAVTSYDVVKEEQLPLIGKCRFYVKKGERFPKKVATMRKAKMIVEEKVFRGPDEWAGVFVCDDDEGNKILRDMEPPQHNKWDATLDKTNGVKVLRSIRDWIRGTLSEMTEQESGSPEEIPGLDQFLPLDDMAEMSGGDTPKEISGRNQKDESPYEVGAVDSQHEEEIESYVQSSNSVNRDSGSAIRKTKGGKGNGSTSTGEHSDDSGDTDTINRIDTTQLKFRIFVPQSSAKNEYCLIIEPQMTQQGALNVIGIGDDNSYPIPLSEAGEWKGKKKYKVSNSFIKDLKLEANKKLMLKLKTKSNLRYALGIESHEG